MFHKMSMKLCIMKCSEREVSCVSLPKKALFIKKLVLGQMIEDPKLMKIKPHVSIQFPRIFKSWHSFVSWVATKFM